MTHALNPTNRPPRSQVDGILRPHGGNIIPGADPFLMRKSLELEREHARRRGGVEVVRPIVEGSGPLFTQILDDQDGKTSSESSTDKVSGFANALILEDSGGFDKWRGYYRLETPVSKFYALAFQKNSGNNWTASNSSGSAPTQFSYKVKLDFITTEDLDLTLIDWDNQNTLTYEALTGHDTIVDLDLEDDNNVSNSGDLNWCIPFSPDGYTLASELPITGVRIKVEDEDQVFGDPGDTWTYGLNTGGLAVWVK